LEQQSREIEQLKRAQMEANRAARELRGGDGRHDLVASTPAIGSGGRRAVSDDRTCPMYRKSFPEPISQQEYERHVQSHF
jgi:NurA-like 5'-3' nuclease